MCTSCKSPPGHRGFAPAAGVIGVLEDAMRTGRVYDLIITALVGGLLWLLVSVVGLY